jgi:hypothetical protein
MIAIVTAATRSYLHCWPQLIRAIATTAAHHEEAHFIFATDQSEESKKAEEYAKGRLPEGWKITAIRFPITEDAKDYKESAQIRIAQLQGAAFEFARRIKADLCWSVESDTIPPAHALRVLEWTLLMPQSDGRPYYDIAAATYPNGSFLGGFGDTRHQIAEDFLPEERKLKPRLKLLLEKCEERMKAIPKPTNSEEAEKAQATAKKEGKRMGRLRELVKKSPPIGNVFEMNAKGYRRRGWMDFAYPGIGIGAVVPSDWCGLGCTLLSKNALALADFTGYVGAGTQDLFLCWSRWHPAGLRIACVPHVACDHIKKQEKEGKTEIVHHRSYHEQEGECRGHLRQRAQPFVSL